MSIKNVKSIFKGGVIASLLIIIGILVYTSINQISGTAKTKDDSKIKISDEGMVYGNVNAPVKIIEYTDFRCASCKKNHETNADTIKQYIDRGEVVYILKPTNDAEYMKLSVSEEKDFNNLSKLYGSTYNSDTSEQSNKTLLDGQLYEKKLGVVNKIKSEVKELNLEMIPTTYINDTKFVGIINKDDLIRTIDKELKK
ncbi:DsbA family protein [Clostridium folliculivorans]|uniref:Thioredoxin n=1 Tax=Clostridium folliculivorans TaxID=2886038 RepID=A0A9W6D9F8_9CLOT|nr:DsbA family protein [Clostridium folliculivorans]GKU24089.1 thioredoxin [Clostridium folliculivorans]GKU30195.1 thioredoxin [Clostridium folliculivorans]